MPHNPASIVRLLYGERHGEEKTARCFIWRRLLYYERPAIRHLRESPEFLAYEKPPLKRLKATKCLFSNNSLTSTPASGQGPSQRLFENAENAGCAPQKPVHG